MQTRKIPHPGWNLEYMMWMFTRLSGLAFFLVAVTGITSALVMGARNQMDLGDLRYSGSVFLGSRTMVGGAYLGYARSDDGDNRFYFTIGQIF